METAAVKTATVHVDQQSVYHYQRRTGLVVWYVESLGKITEDYTINSMGVYCPSNLMGSKFSDMMRERGFRTIPVERYYSEENGNSRCNTTVAIATHLMQSKSDVIILFTEDEALNPVLKELKKMGKTIILFSATERSVLTQYVDKVITPHTMEARRRVA